MRSLFILLLLIVSPIRLLGEISFPAFIELHCAKYDRDDFKWMLDPIILSDSKVLSYPINHKQDTVYIEYVRPSGDGPIVIIWNNRPYNYTYVKLQYRSVMISPPAYTGNKFYAIKQLLSNWETDVLKYVGKKYHSGNNVMPYCCVYMTRIIIEKGNITCDTVTYDDTGGELYYYTQEQLDSLRAEVRLIHQADSIKADSIKAAAQQTVQGPPAQTHRSIWQRIADWFRGVWKCLFG